MARTLQTLRQSDESRTGVEGLQAESRTPGAALRQEGEPTVAAPVEPDADLSEATEEIPYIEVGGKETPIEASPSVLAFSPRPAPKLQLHRPEREEPAPNGDASEVIVEEEVSVRFRPWPAGEPLPPPERRIAASVLAFHEPEHRTCIAYRQVGMAIENQLPAGRPQTLCFTSVSRETRASDLVLNLAIMHAYDQSLKHVIVDANIISARTTELLGFTGVQGLRDVLAGLCSLRQALVDTGVAGLQALPVGRPNPLAPIVAGNAMASVLRHLQARFDWVIIDAPPWDGRPDVTALGAACDAIYVVVRKQEAESDVVRTLLQLIPQQGGRLRGCVVV
jgi:Mrp family chromosome partitioning ATPase